MLLAAETPEILVDFVADARLVVPILVVFQIVVFRFVLVFQTVVPAPVVFVVKAERRVLGVVLAGLETVLGEVFVLAGRVLRRGVLTVAGIAGPGLIARLAGCLRLFTAVRGIRLFRPADPWSPADL